MPLRLNSALKTFHILSSVEFILSARDGSLGLSSKLTQVKVD